MEGSIGCGIILALVVALVVLYLKRQALAAKKLLEAKERYQKKLREAKENYQASLAVLKTKPHDSDLRQRALDWGRYYSNLTRNRKGVTVYDEVAVANDINAACAAVGQPVNQAAIEASTPASVEDRLGQLKSLLDKGLINQVEYDERRARILDEV